MSKPRIPENLRRKLLFGRVSPGSIQYLESLGQPNLGRAVDFLVESHRAIQRSIRPDLKDEFNLPARLPLKH
jgi:hypothetical protein